MLSSTEYVEWSKIPGNGLRCERSMDGIVFTAQYIPREEMALMETGTDVSAEEWQQVLEEKGDMTYFRLEYRLAESSQDILRYSLRSEEEYYARTNYLAFGVEKDVYLQCGKENMPCRLHQYTPHYGISPKAEVLLAFDRIDSTQDITLVLEDQLFGSGIMQFEFTADDLKNIPTIQF